MVRERWLATAALMAVVWCLHQPAVFAIHSMTNSAAASRLPRTSASQLSALHSANGTATLQQQLTSKGYVHPAKNLSGLNVPGSRSSTRSREQYLLNVFEVVVSTLEGKLQRIENLDKAVEHLMRRVELLDSRVADNLGKTDAVITKLRSLDLKLFQGSTDSNQGSVGGIPGATDDHGRGRVRHNDQNMGTLDSRLVSLDRKVSDIGTKLAGLKTQIDGNFLPLDDINAEASEKKPISMNVLEITRAMNAELMSHVSKELGGLRAAADGVDRKLQFHVNLVSENLAKVLNLVSDVHEAVVADNPDAQYYHNRNATSYYTSTTTSEPLTERPITGRATSKLDALVNQMRPIMSVSEKMDEVWDVVVGTKSSVDGLVPKSDELLTQTQRQERAIGQIHQDLRTKTNLIISNLDMVDKRLKKQEDDVAVLARSGGAAGPQAAGANSPTPQVVLPPELLMDPTIDRLVEYGQLPYDDRNLGDQDYTIGTTDPPTPATSQPISVATTQSNANSASSNQNTSAKSSVPRKGGIIFPSVKNKPTLVNSTFSTIESLNYKDVKGYSCVDLMNAGMRESGVYYLQIRGTTYWFLKVFCEQQTSEGGWTVIQRRDDFGGEAGNSRENFNRDWSDYKNGFGDPAKEFWLGNENIYMLTNNEDYTLRVELEDFEGNKRYAQYAHFKIYSEAEYYKLEIDGYEGNAGDSLNDPWYGSNNSPFSTYNRDNDRSSLNCASMLKGGWWWKSCGRGLNGLYLHDPQDLTARQGIVWFRWRGWDYTLKRATMMIRPRGPQQPNASGSSSSNGGAAGSSSAGSSSGSTTSGVSGAQTNQLNKR